MADKDGDNRQRRRNRDRTRAPVIELTAVETPAPVVEPVVGTAETAREQAQPEMVEPAPEPQVEPKPEPGPAVETPDIIAPPAAAASMPERQRYALPIAAAGLVGALFGAGAGALIPSLFGGAPAVDPARMLKVEQGLAELARRPAPPTNAAEVQTLGQKLAGIEAEVKSRLAAQDQKLAAPAPGAPANIQPLSDRIGALDRALAAVDQKAEAARAAAGDSLKAVEPQLQQLASRVALTAQRVEVTAAAPLYSAAEALRQAFQRGAPFTLELSALEALGVKPDQLASLKALAAKGAPSMAQLGASFQPLAMELARSGQPAATGVQAIWESLVKTRATGPGAADSPQGLVAAIENALKSGDVSTALAAWAKLPEPARKASEAWAATARERDAAQKAIRDLQEAALAALRKAAP